MVYLNENDGLYYTDEAFTTLANGVFNGAYYENGQFQTNLPEGGTGSVIDWGSYAQWYFINEVFMPGLNPNGSGVSNGVLYANGVINPTYTGYIGVYNVFMGSWTVNPGTYYVNGVAKPGLDENGTGEFEGTYYINGEATDAFGWWIHNGGGTGEFEGTYYINGEATDAFGWWIHNGGGTGVYEGLLYVDASIYTGNFEGTYYINGSPTDAFGWWIYNGSGTGVYEGLLYVDASIYTGNFEGTYYINGVAKPGLNENGTGEFEGTYYINGVATDAFGWWVYNTLNGGTGVYEGLLYVDASIYTGNFEGTYYINGVAKPGLNENGTGEFEGTYYINGVATDAFGWWVHSTGGSGSGWYEGLYYNGGSIFTGEAEGSYFIDGNQTDAWGWFMHSTGGSGSGWYEGLYYNGGSIFTGEAEGSYFIDGNQTDAWGWFMHSTGGNGDFEGTLYINGVPAAAAAWEQFMNDTGGNGLFEGTYYINGQATELDSSGNGTWNGQTYVNGVVQNGGGGGGGSVNLTSGLQAFYKLSDTSDSSGNNRTLTNNGNVSFASGKIANAAVFDGSNSLDIETFPAQSSNGSTYSFWINFNSLGSGYPAMFSSPSNSSIGEFQMIVYPDSHYAYVSPGNGPQVHSSNSFSTGEWYHIVSVNDNGLVKLYTNGTLTGQENVGANSNISDIYGIGHLAPYGDTYVNGSIDAVGIWNRALSDAEVAALYNSGNGLELEIQAPVVDLESGLQAFYKLSDLSDSSGNNRTLTNNGNVSFASGKIGNAAVFDGSNYLDTGISTSTLTNNDWTLMCWVKGNPNGQQGMYAPILCSANNDLGLQFQDTLYFQTMFGNSLISGSSSLNNDWQFVCIKRQNGVVYFSVNNSQEGSDAMTMPTDGSNILVASNNGGNANFIGSVDAVGIWNRALSDSEVAALYNSGNGLEIEAPVVDLESGLQAFYKLSDTSDSSGNNRTLTNNGNVSFASGKIGNAAVFDGSNFFEIQNGGIPLSTDNPFAVSFWAAPEDVSTSQYNFHLLFEPSPTSTSTPNICIGENKFVAGRDGPGGAIALEAYTAGQWYHVVCIFGSSSSRKLYINGVFQGEDTQDYGSWSGVLDKIGMYPGWPNSAYGYTGKMDAVGIWNRALSDAEVAALYNSGTGLELPAPTGPTIKNGWITNTYWINDVATSLDQNGDGTWVGKLYENGSLFSGSKYSLTFVAGVAQAEQIVTVIGTSIPVAFGLNEAEEPLVELVFASITSAGETTVEQIVPTVLPTGYTVAETVLAYSIDTTATFEGSINVDFILPSNISQAVFDRVKGFHVKNSGAIEEMARVSSDFATRKITVAITSFSSFLFLDEPQTGGKNVKIHGKSKFYGKIKFGV